MVVVETTEEHILTVRAMDARPSLTTDATVNSIKDLEDSPKQPETKDPYEFRNGIKSEDELAQLRKRKQGKGLESYHRRQNEVLTALMTCIDEPSVLTSVNTASSSAPYLSPWRSTRKTPGWRKRQRDYPYELEYVHEVWLIGRQVKIAVWASLIANFSLCVLQLYAAITSLSLSLLATGIDSVFDIGSNVLLLWLHNKASKLDANKWPVGGTRLETIGNIVYGFLMGSVNLVVIVESFRTIITHNSADDTNALHVPSLIAVAAALGVKFALFLYCTPLRRASSQVEVLWEDHRNDLFINGFGLLMSAGGSKLKWFLDPMGAIIIATGVIIAWGRTVYKQFELLAGKSAPHEFLQLLIYNASTFSDEIEQVDTVRAYHNGPDYYVEIDVVMDANTPLWKAHDLSQQLQDKIEVLPNVGRAFVHVDHETTHTPEHRKNM